MWQAPGKGLVETRTERDDELQVAPGQHISLGGQLTRHEENERFISLSDDL